MFRLFNLYFTPRKSGFFNPHIQFKDSIRDKRWKRMKTYTPSIISQAEQDSIMKSMMNCDYLELQYGFEKIESVVATHT